MAVVVLLLFALFAVSFLLGSIPWGVIVSKVLFKKDIRDEGSGNIGATNAARGMGIKGGALVFLLDAGKGALAGALGYFVWAAILTDSCMTEMIILFTGITGNVVTANAAIASHQVSVLAACVAFLGCTLGHIFCPWLGWRGGKGISVAFGCEFFALTPLGALIDLAVFLVFVFGTRIVSLGSVMAAIACPIIAVWMCWNCWPGAVLVILAAMAVLWAHRGNIRRLLNGDEPRFGSSGKDAKRMEEQLEDARPRRERRAEARQQRKEGR